MKNFTLGIIAGNPKDSTSYYRAVGVYGSLRKIVPEMSMMMLEEVSWCSLKQIDVLFMQRPFNLDHVRIAEMAKKNKTPLIIDYDDDLCVVPLSNPTYFVYQAAAENIRRLLKLADKIMVSTMELGIRCQLDEPKKVIVVPNAMDNYLYDRIDGKIETNKSIAWRGSNTHLKDIWEVTPSMKNALTMYGKEWAVDFFGFCPFFIPDAVIPHIKTFNLHPPTDIVEYHIQFQASKPRIVIIPLSFDRFNEAKSHCGWIESVLAGSIVVAPNFAEWHRPGILNYKNPEDFGKVLSVAMSLSEKECQDMNLEAWQHIKKHYLLSHVNLLRKKVLEELIG